MGVGAGLVIIAAAIPHLVELKRKFFN